MFVQFAAACIAGGAFEDVTGSMVGRKHWLGDYVSGFLNGCLGGLCGLRTPGGRSRPGRQRPGRPRSRRRGADRNLGDDLSGEGTGADGGGADSCITTPNSFAGNTPVEVADGTTEPISKLKPGDKVLATDPATGKTNAEPILAVIEGHRET